MCGDWPLADIGRRWAPAIAQELASFAWPLTALDEVRRLLRCKALRLRDVCAFEFTAAVRERNELVHGVPTLSIDLRPSLVPGIHACLDARAVLPLRAWRRLYAFPPCTHQVLSDTTGRVAKELDGRMFWGIMLVIWLWCLAVEMLRIEQPATRIPHYSIPPSQQLRTSMLGDALDKAVIFYTRGLLPLPITHDPGGASRHGQLRDFATDDARDRHRVDWRPFPCTVDAVVRAERDTSATTSTPCFAELREQFAVAWHAAGLPVPADYEADDAQPRDEEARRYQSTRGKGDGRRPASTLPRSLRNGGAPVATFSSLELQMVSIAALSCNAFLLFFVAMQATPLVFAPLNGLEVIGAELHLPTHRRMALAIATRWADHAIADISSTFLVGEYAGGARLLTSPIDHRPPELSVVRTPGERRRRLSLGTRFAWCTLAALAGTIAYDPAARALAACSALRCPVPHLADAVALGHRNLPRFDIGVFATRPMVDQIPDLPTSSLAPAASMLLMQRHARSLMDRLRAAGDTESNHWADVIRPEELQDVPPDLLSHLPSFEDERLDQLMLTPPHVPPYRPRLRPKPLQRPIHVGRCPRSLTDLMLPRSARRWRTWMDRTLADLVCIRDFGVDCDRNRPQLLVFGEQDLYEWARGGVWDFRRSPAECGTMLDYGAPLSPTLRPDFFERELADYPNQQIVGMIRSGVIYQADVELQAVFVPHLTSLPKGFKAVSKELKRLGVKGWYEAYATPPFYPGYYNGQGSQARKLEPDRDRRTTEGGAPRKLTYDSSGLRVLSINEASRVYHMPQHYLSDTRPEMVDWMASRGLPPSPEQLIALELHHGSKHGKQYMPSIRTIMHDLAYLKRVATRLRLPIYIFGNDVKDYFNHLENAVSELPLMNVAWIGDEELQADARQRAYSDDAGNHLIFISERRMGFGIHPNSGCAQDLSEAIDFIFRKRMDAVADAELEASTDAEVQRWLAERRVLEAKHGGHQRRLYSAHTYCDDNIVIVVGVDLALKAIAIRAEIEREAGLIMAIPEKRMLGTWGVWLGIYIFAGLGIVVVPRHKLIRASEALRRALDKRLPFDEYQSLMGLLEHIRYAMCLPRRVMHGLYRPHGPQGESRSGPSTLVLPTFFMARQLLSWLERLGLSAGAAATDAVRRSSLARPRHSLVYVGSSDAATDSEPPGLGGYMHGYFWYIALRAVHVAWLHISVLELLATGFSTIIFRRIMPPSAELCLGADASATATTLTLHSQSSEALIDAHHELLALPSFQQAQRHTSLGQLRGDANEASDAVSRGKWDTFRALCRRLRVRPQEVMAPTECLDLLDRVLRSAILRGVRVRPNPYVATPQSIPEAYHHLLPPAPRARLLTRDEQHLGKRRRNCEDGDGPGAYAAAKAAAKRQPSFSAQPPRYPSQYWLARHTTPVPPQAPVTLSVPTTGASRNAVAATNNRRQPQVKRMPSVVINGERFAAPVPRKERAISKRKLVMLELADRRARRMAPPRASDDQHNALAQAVRATHELAEHGAAVGTLDIDDHAFVFWERFCALYGWSPTLDGDADWARSHPDEISQRLAIFQAWVYPQLSGRGDRSDAKPRTVFNNYVLAVLRMLSREHMPMPKAKHVEKNLAGLMRSFKQIYGVSQLMPGRKQPFTPTMWARIEALEEGHPLRGREPWAPSTRHRDRLILRLGRTLWRTGHRLGEIIAHPSGEINFLTRSCVSITKASGRKIAVPSTRDWQQLASGDLVLLAPCASKSDQFGEEHCPYPSVLPCDGSPCSAAMAVRDIELEQPCDPNKRDTTPLFGDENGQPFTYAILHTELRKLIATLFGESAAKAFSWHSIRIGLACALHAADCPDAVIQLICRWANPASLKVYRQVGVEKNAYWTERAQHVVFDATRVNNIPVLDRDDAMLRNIEAFDGTLAETPMRRAVEPTAPPTTYVVPGGTVQATTTDDNGLVNLRVNVYNNLWPGYDNTFARTWCQVAARCCREFRHPDGSRCLTYLIEYDGAFFPIKHSGLLDCISQQVRKTLPAQRP